LGVTPGIAPVLDVSIVEPIDIGAHPAYSLMGECQEHRRRLRLRGSERMEVKGSRGHIGGRPQVDNLLCFGLAQRERNP
jgi:hypothetical protein